mmetsp:Transcript_48798/g.90533  ORF Transcript_48798/g.90533 Transcript_48798/m.90533 type:complete len:205 (+) Transcript_48798:46-660(+)
MADPSSIIAAKVGPHAPIRLNTESIVGLASIVLHGKRLYQSSIVRPNHKVCIVVPRLHGGVTKQRSNQGTVHKCCIDAQLFVDNALPLPQSANLCSAKIRIITVVRAFPGWTLPAAVVFPLRLNLKRNVVIGIHLVRNLRVSHVRLRLARSVPFEPGNLSLAFSFWAELRRDAKADENVQRSRRHQRRSNYRAGSKEASEHSLF